MPTRIVLGALALGVIASCAHHRPDPPAAAAAWVPCSTEAPGARCDIRVIRDANGPYSCELGRFRVEPDFLGLTGRKPVNIQWELPQGFGFCDGDGVGLKPDYRFAQKEVLETYSSDSKDGARAGFEPVAPCRKFRVWRWGNAAPGVVHAYEIRFHEAPAGAQCRIDPWIRNGSAS
jgi:hypothetical protein